jgi:uncharacterized protein (UPF0333 family)
MKTKKLVTLFITMLSAVIFFTACSKDTNNPVTPDPTNSGASIKINGGGFVNKQVNLSSGISAYVVNDNATYVQFIGTADSDSLYLVFIFEGKQTGTFSWNSNSTETYVLHISQTGGVLYANVGEGSTTVTSYGDVGGKIEGKAAGKLVDMNTQQIEMTIDGTFSVVRGPDDTE